MKTFIVEKVLNHHKAIVCRAWKLRGDPEYRSTLCRSLGKLLEIRDNGNTKQVF